MTTEQVHFAPKTILLSLNPFGLTFVSMFLYTLNIRKCGDSKMVEIRC